MSRINYYNTIDIVKEKRLCTGCGTCYAICPQEAVLMRYDKKFGVYEAVRDDTKCEGCGLCVEICPGIGIDLEADRPQSQANLNKNLQVGPYKGMWRAYSTDDNIRLNGASGGVVTQTLKFLIDQAEVDGAIVTRMNEDQPLQTKTYIAWKIEGLHASQKSHYTPTPLNMILKSIFRSEYEGKRFAYVGLPSHVQGLRKIQKRFPEMISRIPYVISLFTAHVPTRKLTEFILYKERIPTNEVQRIEYRGGGNPGRMRVLLKDGTEKLVPHLKWYYSGHAFPVFFYRPSEWLHFDKLSQFADFSMGDNWQRGLAEQKGASTVVTRSDEAESLFRRMKDEGVIEATPMTAEQIIMDQDLNKKLNVGIRHKVWKMLGNEVPQISPQLSVKWSGALQTLRWAIYTRLLYRPIPFFIMDKIIKTDYVLRKKLLVFLHTIIRYFFQILKGAFPTYNRLPERSGKYKILMMGGYGDKDIGDEAMPFADIIHLRNEMSRDELEIVMLSPDPLSTYKTHQERSVQDLKGIQISSGSPLAYMAAFMVVGGTLLGALCQKCNLRLRLWFPARSILDELTTADAIFNVGGGNINSVIRNELVKKCTLYLAASLLNKKVVLSGQTMGPYYGFIDPIFAKLALNKVHMITFRDKDISNQRLLDIGVRRPLMIDAADDAYALPSISRSEAEAILEAETGITSDFIKQTHLIFMNLKGALKLFKGKGRGGGVDKEAEVIANIADRLIDDFAAVVVFLPTDYSASVDDREVHDDIVQKMQNQNNVHVVREEYSAPQLKGIIGIGDVAIGARYHFNVFAASMNVPFLGMASGEYQLTKLRGLSDLCGVPQCFVNEDLEYATADKIWPQVTDLINNAAHIKKQLIKVNEGLSAASKIAVEELTSLLKQKDF